MFLRRRALEFLEIDNKECVFIFIVLLFTTIVAVSIVDDKSLFIANGVRIFTRIQVALQGIESEGLVPIYNPGIAHGDATYLWNTPSFKVHAALVDYLINFKSSIYFFNALSFFILFLSTLALGALFRSIVNHEDSNSSMLAVTAVAVLTGLNFLFLQTLESFKANYAYPFAYLFLSIIIDNPKRFNDFLILMYISALLITTHLPYGSGVLFIGACLFLITKSYYLKDKSEIKEFLNLTIGNKIKIILAILIIVMLPLFYISAGFIFNEFMNKKPEVTFSNIKADFIGNVKGFYHNELSFFSLKYPDVNRIDDHKFGFFISILGPLSLFLSFMFYKSEYTKKLRLFTLGFLLNLIIVFSFYSYITLWVGGFFRAIGPSLLILMGASILTLIRLINNKYAKYILIVSVILAFIHTIPYAKQNISNIHKEYFASGELYREELDFIRKLPIDGRILTYGLFNNAVDFGGNYLTGRYFSRDERDMFNIQRRLFEKVHGQNSFGEPDIILPKSGAELYNYLRLGGWKYLFMDARHPISQNVLLKLNPNFARRLYQGIPQEYKTDNLTDYAYPIYQNGPLIILVVNNTNYVEKVDLVKNIPDEIYKQGYGYKYITISPYYNFDMNLNFKENPREPEPLNFKRLSPTQVQISGNFEKDDFVVFKEQYFTRWKAYMDNKEIPVISTIHETVLIKTEKGDNILLKYVVLPKEKILGVISLVAHLSLIIIIIYLVI